MRNLALFLTLLSSAAPVAAEHFILTPKAPLTAEDRVALEAEGITVLRPLTRGRYVAVTDSRTRSRIATDARVRSFEPMRTESRVHPSARRATELTIAFHDDVSIDAAREAIAEAGASLDDALVFDFAPMRTLIVHADAAALERLGADDRVLTVAATPNAHLQEDNAISAALSRVDVVQAAPYGLTGAGVLISLSELGVTRGHSEFGDRLTIEPFEGAADNGRHATHVAGTILSAGASNARARGMAPGATVRQFRVPPRSQDWMRDKRDRIAASGAIADNNSWGAAEGWKDETTGMVWTDHADWYGAYHRDLTAPLDEIARTRNVLFVFSSGNDGVPQSEEFWAQHYHLGSNGFADLTQKFCYSKDGSGTDCPTPPNFFCTAGRMYCETVKHHPTEPYDTTSVLGAAKNAIAVGNVDGDGVIAPSSSRGPAKDGRVKPDLVARGTGVFSTVPTNAYATLSGTSMSTPVVTGITALLTEQWRRTFAADPRIDELKALLIAGAEDLGTPGPDATFGFGLADAKSSVDLILADGGRRDHIRRAVLAQGNVLEIPLVVSTRQDLRVVVQWIDPEIAFLADDPVNTSALVNDLDAKLVDAAGTVTLPWRLDPTRFDAPAIRGENHVDNTELLEITNAAPGVYRLIVTATRIADRAPQELVVVANAPALQTAAAPRRRATKR